MSQVEYRLVTPLREDVIGLILKLNAHNLSHCPPEICHLATAEQLAETDCQMIGAFNEEKLCGIGAVKFYDNYGEITRMFVEEQCRGMGIARHILELLIQAATDRKMEYVRLETSERFVSAFHLYQSMGFVACAPFGEYVHAPHNTYLEKNLKDL